MEKLTLGKTWVLCLRMWKWIAGQWKKGCGESVNGLKEIWLDEHGFGNEDINEDCFFCEYAEQEGVSCFRNCPGKIVSKRFSCTNKTYHYRCKPIAFYNKLVQLNKKRLNK